MQGNPWRLISQNWKLDILIKSGSKSSTTCTQYKILKYIKPSLKLEASAINPQFEVKNRIVHILMKLFIQLTCPFLLQSVNQIPLFHETTI